MSDARISTGLPSHPKTKKLIKRLGHAGGWSLVCLFLWVAANRPSGDLLGLSVEDIELAADWTGNEGEFVEALVAVRFLDGAPENYEVHDWAEHNPWAAGFEMRSAKAKWNAVKRHHGEAEADRQVIEYAAVRKAGENSLGDAARNATSIANSTALSNAPSPSPSPSPSLENPFAAADESPSSPAHATLKKSKASFDYATSKFIGLSGDMLTAWSEAYPAIDVRSEIANAKVWMLANPKNRKSNIERFLTNWLSRAQDNAPRIAGHANNQRPHPGQDTSAAGRVRANADRELAEIQRRQSQGGGDHSVEGDVIDVRP